LTASFFLSWVAKTQLHHWTKRMVSELSDFRFLVEETSDLKKTKTQWKIWSDLWRAAAPGLKNPPLAARPT